MKQIIQIHPLPKKRAVPRHFFITWCLGTETTSNFSLIR